MDFDDFAWIFHPIFASIVAAAAAVCAPHIFHVCIGEWDRQCGINCPCSLRYVLAAVVGTEHSFFLDFGCISSDSSKMRERMQVESVVALGIHELASARARSRP